ncbi:MAG: T9SS type A sorting domain-containing protein, partial [Bacteroidales bacterium]|nr:T9SS type A sorting domain-containing protein [Bacteroidales bacterium]
MRKQSTKYLSTLSKRLCGVMLLLSLCCTVTKAHTSLSSEPMNEMSLCDSTLVESPKTTTPIQHKITISVSNRVMKVTGVEDGTKVEIYSLLGNKVFTDYVSNGELNLPVLNKGIYLVRIE